MALHVQHKREGAGRLRGSDRGEKAALIVDPANREEHLKRLAEAGMRVQQTMDTGQLEVFPWTDAYVRDHRFGTGCNALASRQGPGRTD